MSLVWVIVNLSSLWVILQRGDIYNRTTDLELTREQGQKNWELLVSVVADLASEDYSECRACLSMHGNANIKKLTPNKTRT